MQEIDPLIDKITLRHYITDKIKEIDLKNYHIYFTNLQIEQVS